MRPSVPIRKSFFIFHHTYNTSHSLIGFRLLIILYQLANFSKNRFFQKISRSSFFNCLSEDFFHFYVKALNPYTMLKNILIAAKKSTKANNAFTVGVLSDSKPHLEPMKAPIRTTGAKMMARE